MDDGGLHALRQLCSDAQTFFLKHCGLLDFHANDFWTCRLWERLQEHWVPHLAQATHSQLLACLTGAAPETWPADLSAYVRTAHSLSLPRQPALGGLPATVTQRGGVTPKKQHEVAALAALVAQLAASLGVHTVVDVGAGKGHLANELATAHGLSVLAVDMSDSLVQQATGQSGRGPQQASAMGNFTGLDGGSVAAEPGAAGASGSAAGRGAGGAAAGGRVQVAAVAATLTSENVVQVLQQLLDQHQQQQQQLAQHGQVPPPQQQQLAQHGQVQPPQQQREQQREREPLQSGGLHGPAAGAQRSPRVILVGLHACGDLTPALLRAFLNWPAAAAVVSLGCCYNLLSEEAVPGGGSGGASTSHVPWHRPGAAAGPAGTAAAQLGQDAAPRPCCYGACAARATTGGSCHRAAAALAGFPMSQHYQGVSLGWAARTAACHTNERLLAAAAAEGGGGGCQAAERSAAQQAYRAALNRLLQLRCPEVPLSQLSLGRSARVKRKTARPAGTRLALEVQQPQKPPAGAVRNAAAGAVGGAHGPASDCTVPAAACSATEAGFVAYVEEALSKLGLEADVGPDETAQFWREDAAPRAPLLPALCALRQVAGPVVESLLLVDRALFLLEGTLPTSAADTHTAGTEAAGAAAQQHRQDKEVGEVLGPGGAEACSPAAEQQEGSRQLELCGARSGARALLGVNRLLQLPSTAGLVVAQSDGVEVALLPLFDPVVSPRNIALLAVKRELLERF